MEILSPAENPDGPAGGNAAREAGGGFAQAAAGNDVIRKPGSQAEYRGLYLGLDIGSTSTKAVLIDRGKRLVKGFYTRTGGRPVDAVLLLVRFIQDYLNQSPYILAGAATTGSGRKMIKTLFGADLEINEITAHAMAAVALYPQVDTIIEIGGQDSKFTLLRDGRVYYSHMNYVCAAGTGSFIEEQARLLHLDLGDFSAAALGSQAPHTSDRCTVYMERDLAELRGRGFSRRALAAAVLFSVRDNYLAKVVNKSAIGEHIVFQGATARNKALVAAFEQIVEKPIHVSPYCHLTGALGAALYCAKKNIQKSGFVFEQDEILIQDETCSLCSNRCLLKVARVGGNISAWGMKCGREYADRKPRSAAPDNTPGTRFHAALSGDIRPSAQDLQGGRPALHPQNSRPAIMILDALYNLEYNHLWRDVLCGLGFEVEIIRSSAASIALGRELVNSDFCAPIVVAHGLLKQALERGSGPIFLPALIREREEPAKTEPTFREKTGDCYFCYYSQYLPTVLSNLTSVRIGNRFVSPLLGLGPGRERDTAVRIFTALRQAFPDFPGLSADRVEEEFHRAYETFTANRRRLARGFLGGSPSGPNEFTVILLGRPYVLFDQALNLALPVKFAEYGALVYSMYEIDPPIPLQGHARKYYEAMHWNYGRRILRCAEYSAQRENTFVVFLSCFRCSPDSFLLSYVKDIMTHYRKPFLLLQLDEHILDTGYTTRIEAAMETFRNYRRERARKRKTGADGAAVAENRHAGVDVAGAVFEPGDNVLIPYINNLISGFWADCFENAGFSARVLESSKRDLLTGYRYANGGECMPAVAIVGGAIEAVERLGLEPGRTCLYIPTVCMACNFPQFPVLADMAFTAAGLHGLKVARINSMNQGEYLPGNLPMKIFEAGVLGSLLYKLYFRVAPYETRKGSTGRALERSQELLGRAFRQGNDVRAAFKETCELFHGIERNEKDGRKTRIGILGDFYVKYNEAVNQNLQELIQSHDAELIIPSFSELTFHFFDADAEIDPNEGRHLKILRLFEQRYEKMAGVLLEGQAEPNWRECVQLMREYGLLHYLPGETSITCARALYSIKHRCVDGIVHVNPMFCCPGVVSSSIFRKIQQDFGIPVVDLFYDGTGRPNHMLIPHLHYLKRRNT